MKTRVLKIQCAEDTQPIYLRVVDNIISFTPDLRQATRFQPKHAWFFRRRFGGSIHRMVPVKHCCCACVTQHEVR